MSNEEQSMPLRIVLVSALLFVLVFFWCLAASGYATEVEGRVLGRVLGPRHMGIKAMGFLLWHGLYQLANLPAVLSFTFTQQMWLVITLIVVEVLVLIGFVGIKIVERNLEGPQRRKR